MSEIKYAYPYPAPGTYERPPVMAPPQYVAPPPPSDTASQLYAVAVFWMSVAATLSSFSSLTTNRDFEHVWNEKFYLT
ncbi:hypothetical protein L484_014805 [Morus notabilis]|uniref:Uncharacterized protein n=1 Tax=Morus notabilis TaxID=981085 RepID=W9SKK9_9ROSA|nr:hypothetical protein L484_014805 [Morus notabilis]